MAKARFVVGSSVKNENILWATKFFAPDSFTFIEIDGKKIMVANTLEYGRAKKEARVDEVVLENELIEQDENLPDSEKKGLYRRLFEKYGVDAVIVSPDFPAGIYKFLSEKGIAFEFKAPLFPEREVKYADEIADIAYAQQAMEEVFPMLVKILADAKIRDGKVWDGGEYVTSEILRQVFDTELMRRDCVCEATIIASGAQAADPHCIGTGPILANTLIVFDMFPRSRKNWYWSDMTRMVSKGPVSFEARKIYDAVYETQLLGVRMVKPGVNFGDINKAAAEHLEKLGHKTGKEKNGDYFGFFHSIGHGVGLEIHEPPFARKNQANILQPGNVITIEPGLYYKDIGGVRIEDTLVVTENGHENIARIPKELIELP